MMKVFILKQYPKLDGILSIIFFVIYHCYCRSVLYICKDICLLIHKYVATGSKQKNFNRMKIPIRKLNWKYNSTTKYDPRLQIRMGRTYKKETYKAWPQIHTSFCEGSTKSKYII